MRNPTHYCQEQADSVNVQNLQFQYNEANFHIQTFNLLKLHISLTHFHGVCHHSKHINALMNHDCWHRGFPLI